jgi:hypothetical protein
MAVLSGPAVAMLLAILRLTFGKEIPEAWVSPGQATLRFGLSEDTRTLGFKELQAYRLITTTRRPLGKKTFDWSRMRNEHLLNVEAFQRRPGDVPSSSASVEDEDEAE